MLFHWGKRGAQRDWRHFLFVSLAAQLRANENTHNENDTEKQYKIRVSEDHWLQRHLVSTVFLENHFSVISTSL